MTFSHPASPPEGNLSDLRVALWLARARAGDIKERSARPDEDWFFDLEHSAAIVTVVPSDENKKPHPMKIGDRIYRPYFAAAAHIRAQLYRLQSAGGSTFADMLEAAEALEQRQVGLDTQYGLRTTVISDAKGRGSIDLERV